MAKPARLTARPPAQSTALGARVEPPRYRGAVVVLLIVGVVLMIALPLTAGGRRVNFGAMRWIITLAITLLAIAPGVTERLSGWGERIGNPSPRQRAIAAVGISILASLYLLLTAFNQDRDFFAKTHDECSYLIQARMLAGGHVAMPAHPLGAFLDSFYLITDGVYASMYFPGTALMSVPGIWLGWPTWLMPLLVSGAVVGLVYRITTELLDGVAGAMAAALMLSLTWFRMLSIMIMSQNVLLLLGLIMIIAAMNWRRGHRPGWLLLLGAATGWAMITRPVDALCFAIPVSLMIVPQLRLAGRRGAIGIGLALLAIIPFAALQLKTDRVITGSYLRTPFGLYADRDYPGTSFGFHPLDANAAPRSASPQKQLDYRQHIIPLIELHQPGNLARAWFTRWLPTIADVTLPARPLLALEPVGLLGLWGLRLRSGQADRRRWFFFAPLPLFIIGYVFYTFFLEHYAVVIAPMVLVLVLLGIRAISAAWPQHRRLGTALSLFVLGCGLTSTWELNRAIDDEPFRSDIMRQLNTDLLPRVPAPAVVLFEFDPQSDYYRSHISAEPVYNTDVAWPDDAAVIRLHDLPGRTQEVLDYYAHHGPPRTFWRFHRTGDGQFELKPIEMR